MRKNNTFQQGPPIPAITDPELKDAIRALTRSARFMRGLVLKAAWDERPIADVVREHEATSRLAEAVIERWSAHLGVADDDIPPVN